MDWSANERRILAGLKTPAHIQQFLDEMEYDERSGAASPRAVMKSGRAQCFSGGNLMYIDRAIDDAPRAWKLPRKRIPDVSNVSESLRTAGLAGANPAGLWRRS